MGSTRGVNERKIRITSRLFSVYSSNRGARKTPSGHARLARVMGVAENTPKRRAS
jgi:hypothetical protein